MKIVVCIKQVPNTTEVKFDPKTGTLIREGLPTIINPEDKNALEEALAIAAPLGGQVTVISMGPAQADYALRETLAMGAHEAVLLSDRAFAGADTWATSYALAKAIEKHGEFSLIFCGRQAIDGDTAQVGPELAEHLDIPHVTYVRRIVSLDEKYVVVERALEDGYEVVESTLPALLTTLKELNVPRYPSASGIVTAFDEKKVAVWTAETVGADPAKIGLKGSPTQVKRTFTPSVKGTGKILTGTHKEAVQQLVQELRAKHVV
ncbi:MAG: electron transfer flavoprotein beta subunit [Bacillota bacterium]|nr:MAG: electron transfer flavoprotein beta subunit [Bacillota bacterium]MBS3949819.1 electron transfer flavoprotein subunit beta/FixA family protein [Peptococcaceae bacterium]